jgi:DNA polymerase III delta subunit
MKILLTGNNDYEIEQKLRQIVVAYKNQITTIDGSSQDIDLHAALLGQDLFSSNRLVIIRNISEDIKNLETLIKLLPSVSEEISVVVVDQKLDKRTKNYKELIKNLEIFEYELLDENDTSRALKWALEEVDNRGIKIDRSVLEEIIHRSGFNQWNIIHAIDKLELIDNDEFNIDEIVEPAVSENVFHLLETVLSKDLKKLEASLSRLKSLEDPFRLMSLVSSQFVVVLALVHAGANNNVAKDLGANPYMVSKLTNLSKKISKSESSRVLKILLEGDEDIKNSNNDPWVVLTKTLTKIAN